MVLGRVIGKLAQRRKRPGYTSRFGGLWTDRPDAVQEVERRRAAGNVGDEDARRLGHWVEHGFWVERGAVSPDVIDAIAGDVEAIWRRRDPAVRLEIDGRYLGLSPEHRTARTKLVDLYAHSPAALEAAFAPAIHHFLDLVFERHPLLFQSLSFEQGSEQAVHQDTAYVVVSPPLEFAAAWIALEDVRPGSGELVYYPGSQRLDEFLFRGGYRNWNRERDGLEAQERYHRYLLEAAAERGLERQTFLPRKGDVLFWSADLAHGGAPIQDRSLTRRSLVCHYCPAGARPYYFHYRADRRARVPHGASAAYASSHYDLGGPVVR